MYPLPQHPSPQLTGCWTLTECREVGVGQHIIVPHEPTMIGRTTATRITLSCSTVSKRHAEIQMADGHPVLTDLGSTNGTFVNGIAANHTVLADGDIVQFADQVFRVNQPAAAAGDATQEGTALPFAAAILQFEQLMSGNSVVPHYQPLVRLIDAGVVGYELLARSRLEQLRNPAAMFDIAAHLGQECALSELVRREAGREASTIPDCYNLFVNTHPKEIVQDRFLSSLDELREIAPSLNITVEVHEAAVTNRDDMQRLRSRLQHLNMQLAYDDFGNGQARLDELAEIPPDYLKFDIKLIRDIDKAIPARLTMMRTLVAMTRELGVTALAEGIETQEEALACRDIGFELAQGYYFGKPQPAEDLSRAALVEGPPRKA